jgi:hypothetical protein
MRHFRLGQIRFMTVPTIMSGWLCISASAGHPNTSSTGTTRTIQTKRGWIGPL